MRFTSNRRCVLFRAGSIVADATICSVGDVDFVFLPFIEPDIKSDLLFTDYRTDEIIRGRERV